jgi:hypothetical protein
MRVTRSVRQLYLWTGRMGKKRYTTSIRWNRLQNAEGFRKGRQRIPQLHIFMLIFISSAMSMLILIWILDSTISLPDGLVSLAGIRVSYAKPPCLGDSTTSGEGIGIPLGTSGIQKMGKHALAQNQLSKCESLSLDNVLYIGRGVWSVGARSR